MKSRSWLLAVGLSTLCQFAFARGWEAVPGSERVDYARTPREIKELLTYTGRHDIRWMHYEATARLMAGFPVIIYQDLELRTETFRWAERSLCEPGDPRLFVKIDSGSACVIDGRERYCQSWASTPLDQDPCGGFPDDGGPFPTPRLTVKRVAKEALHRPVSE